MYRGGANLGENIAEVIHLHTSVGKEREVAEGCGWLMLPWECFPVLFRLLVVSQQNTETLGAETDNGRDMGA